MARKVCPSSAPYVSCQLRPAAYVVRRELPSHESSPSRENRYEPFEKRAVRRGVGDGCGRRDGRERPAGTGGRSLPRVRSLRRSPSQRPSGWNSGIRVFAPNSSRKVRRAPAGISSSERAPAVRADPLRMSQPTTMVVGCDIATMAAGPAHSIRRVPLPRAARGFFPPVALGFTRENCFGIRVKRDERRVVTGEEAGRFGRQHGRRGRVAPTSCTCRAAGASKSRILPFSGESSWAF